MTRFREEIYAAAWYKAAVRKSRAVADFQGDAGARGSQYFQKSLSVRKAIRKAQAKDQGRLV